MGPAPVLGLLKDQHLGPSLLRIWMMEPLRTNTLREHHKRDRGEIDIFLVVAAERNGQNAPDKHILQAQIMTTTCYSILKTKASWLLDRRREILHSLRVLTPSLLPVLNTNHALHLHPPRRLLKLPNPLQAEFFMCPHHLKITTIRPVRGLLTQSRLK